MADLSIQCVCVCVCERERVSERERAHTQNMSHESDGKPGGWLGPNSLTFKTKKTPPPKYCYWGWLKVSVYDPQTKHRRKSCRSQKLSTRSCWLVFIYLFILLTYLSIHLPIYLLVYLSLYFTYLFIHSLIFNLCTLHPNSSRLLKRHITFLVSKSANIWRKPFDGKGC